MSDVDVKIEKTRKKPESKRVGPACGTTPETKNGCGRPLPVSGTPATAEDLAELQAKIAKLTERAARAAGATVKPIEPKVAE